MGGILQVDTIQNNNTSNLITQTNVTTITIGTSGQNISIPSGATLTGPGAGLIWQSVQTTSFTAVKGKAYPVNTTSGVITVTLPATPNAGDQVQVVDYAGTADTNRIIINPNGEDIEGQTDSLVLRGEREGVILTYIDSTQGWIATSGINEGTDALSPNDFSTDFLIIAGGGGGGATGTGGGAGGGGAGGYRSFTSQTLVVATNYTITVGAGGAGAVSPGANGTSGSDSVAFGGAISSGGGGGGGGSSGSAPSGGSGGGGSNSRGEGSGNTPNASPSQGNNGGAGGPFSNNYTGGGGGGASAVGVAGTSTVAGNGGAGTASSITGTSVTRAGGGGGGTYLGGTNGTGGTGGGGAGGNGANNPATGTAGTVNTGGGGGGGGYNVSVGSGGAGGSGIVIVKYPDTLTISNPGGGLTSSTATAGGFSVTSFTAGTGNVQFN